MGNSQAVVGNHGPLPVDEIPYAGPPIEYCLITVNVQLKSHMTFSFAPGQNVITSDVDAYYPILAQPCQDGFKLLSFIKVTGQGSRSGFFTPSVVIPYQGIFSRYVGTMQQPAYQLRVEKSMVHLHLLRAGIIFGLHRARGHIDSNIAHIYQIINDHASRGGKFICMEMTGQQTSQGMRAAMQGVGAEPGPGLGTDLFFDIPTQPSAALYTYTAVAVPIKINHTFTRLDVICDWMGNLAAYLDQGWKLADIFLNCGKATFYGQNPSMMATLVSSLNSIWFFEKEVSKLQDPTPLYEGTVIDVFIKTKGGFRGHSSDMNLMPMLQEMGNRGWEFVCLLEIPKIVSRGFATVTLNLIAFFQRPLRRTVPEDSQPQPLNMGFLAAQQATEPLAAQPPSYTQVMHQEKKEVECGEELF